jgi:hypothetical protein
METVPSPFKPTDGFHDCYLRAISEQRSFVVEVRNLQKWFPEEHEKRLWHRISAEYGHLQMYF